MMDSLVSYSDSESEEDENASDSFTAKEPEPEGQNTLNANDDYSELETRGSIGDKQRDNCNLLHRKRKLQEENLVQGLTKSSKVESSLPLPDTIKTLFVDHEQDSKHYNDPDQHGGRVRSFDHVEGNWATHVGICYEPDDSMEAVFEELFLCLRPMSFQPMKEYHISLSRTVAIRHHWIPSLMESLQKKFTSLPGCFSEITSIKVFSNDEKTRSFLALEVAAPNKMLHTYSHVIDDCFGEFRLQKYYNDPSFHISIGWCLGNVTSQITTQKLSQLQEILDKNLEEHPDNKLIDVTIIQCKTGNKFYDLKLK